MKIVAGLGNPGSKYEKTRHNVGFLVIDRLAERHGISVSRLKWKALVGEGRIGSEKVVLVKPQIFMNNSGESLVQIMQFYRPEIDDLILVVDDIDIEFGTVRVRPKGSAGSHNGLKSIVRLLGEDGFPRVKIAVGKKPTYMDLADFVLSGFTTEEKKVIEKELDWATEAVECIVNGDLDLAMNEYNAKRI